MKRAIFSLFAFAVAIPLCHADTARGVVYHDLDRDNVREANEPGIAGVRVSNGEQVVQTDREGRYSLPVDGDTVVFITKPAGWNAPLDRFNTPRTYYVHCPAGSPKLRYPGVTATGPLPASVDFALVKGRDAKKFEALVFGDSQPYTMDQVDYFGHEYAENLVGTKAIFGVTLGDVVGDNLALRPTIAAVCAAAGVPWHYVPGNHDRNYDAPEEADEYATWRSHFGPTYYSFDEGKAHFVVIEDVLRSGKTGYKQGLGRKETTWLQNDLAATPKDRLVVLMMHIPLVEPVAERKEILKAIAPFKNTLSLGAHWHEQSDQFLGQAEGWPSVEPHHSLVVGTSCGPFWAGELDSVGLPMALMSDGTPQGYVVLSVDGTSYKLRYQVSRRPADYQMNVTAPKVLLAAETAGTEVVANVFLASSRSKVEMKVGDGPWGAMARDERVDPNLDRIVKLQEAKKLPATGNTLDAGKSSHIWVGKLPALNPGVHLITVRATDVFGQVVYGRRVVRVR